MPYPAVSRAIPICKVPWLGLDRALGHWRHGAMKILVIEDDAETCAYLVNGLQEEGHLVDQAGNGRDGLFLATGGRYDVMIVDRMLPSLEGLGVVQPARAAG